jgi:predicted transcriptional regulator/transcriptional regulator with XRE-family HTH domain
MRTTAKMGGKIRALRRRQNLTQVQLAERLQISPSYLNLIEHDRRPLSAALLIKLAQMFRLDLQAFAADEESRLMTDLLEVFGDRIFDGHELTTSDMRELASASPGVARAVLTLYQSLRAARASGQKIAPTVTEEAADDAADQTHMPNEEVGDLIQRNMNYFPELEDAAVALWRDARLEEDSLYRGLVRYLSDALRVTVRIDHAVTSQRTSRQYDPVRRTLHLSEVLAPRSRNFQLAHQIGLLTQRDTIDRLARDPMLTTDAARVICRVALANYYAGAVLMPYEAFLGAARVERYDIELLGHRFRTSFEQVCHRLTTLRRPGAEGVPFHMLRVDVAGNISKRFSASGIRFARFNGACPRWNVCVAFLTPGMTRVQVSRMDDGRAYFCVARTVPRGRGGYSPQTQVLSIGLGCEVKHARELVYADGVDVDNLQASVPVGVTCRLCQRMDCEQRAFPPIQHPLRVDENVRGVSFYAPVGDR